MIIREALLRQMSPCTGGESVKVLVGLRRCGKSTLLHQIQAELRQRGATDDDILSLDFEQAASHRLRTADAILAHLRHRLAGRTRLTHVFLDEIQRVSDWLCCVRACRTEFAVDLYLAGPCSIAEPLGKDVKALEVFPLSFVEFCDLRREYHHFSDLRLAFEDYAAAGGLPIASLLRDRTTARQYAQDLFTLVLLQDVALLGGIRNLRLLEHVLRDLASESGRLFRATDVCRRLEERGLHATRETVLHYSAAAQAAGLFFCVQREDLSRHRLLEGTGKLYVADLGFLESSASQASVTEHLVAQELRRRGFSLTTGRLGARSVDFIARRGNQTLFIQAAGLLDTPGADSGSAFGVLQRIRDSSPKFVISADDGDLSRDGIQHWNVRRFLTDSTWG